MYGWIWQNLPGPTAARVVQAVLLVLAVATLLLFGVFPWLAHHLPFDPSTAQ
jgi:hypothetical protein